MSESLEVYLRNLRAGLPPGLGAHHTARLLREIEEHILEGCEAEQERGATPGDALECTLARLGPPGTIAHGFYTVVDRKRIRRGRLVLFAALALGFLAVAVPLVTLPASAGPGGGSMRDLLLCASVLGLYAWAGLNSARAESPEEAHGLWYGMGAGLFTSGLTSLGLVCSLLLLALLWGESAPHVPAATLLQIDEHIESVSASIPLIAVVVLSVVAGAMAAARTGRIYAAAQAGLWNGMLSALGIAAASLLIDNPIAIRLARLEWVHDPTCTGAHVPSLVACEIGDSLGGVAVYLLIFPLLGIGLGLIGGLMARRGRAARPSGLVLPLAPAAAIPMDSARPESVHDTHIYTLALFCLMLLAVFIASLQLHVL